MTTTGIVFDIQRFSIHDGPGIRTTVFLKGCHLRCTWCHNPESWSFKPELAYAPTLCIACGACMDVCPVKAHSFEGGKHILNRELCTNCGKCAEVCPSHALEMAGKEMTVDQVIKEVERDKPFYENSEGGLTLSGGEPLAQTEFTAEILEAAQAAGIHTAIETAGFYKAEALDLAAPHCDLILLDIKAAPADYEQHTGKPFDKIEARLEQMAGMDIPIWLRLPLMPGVNDTPEHFENVKRLKSKYTSVQKIDIIPYHGLAEAKYERFGCKLLLKDVETPSKEQISNWKKQLEISGS